MSYDEQLTELQRVITSDESTEEQRRVAREAKKRLIEGSIGDALARIKERTAAYRTLIDKLKGVVDRIKANQLTTAEEDLDSVIGDIRAAVEGTSSPS